MENQPGKNLLDVFDKTIRSKDGTTEKKISDVIDVEKHTWSTEGGNIIMKHEAILHLRKFTGAKFLKPELQKEISNPGNIVYLAVVEFPDGEISYEIGEANNDNTFGFSKNIKPTMAFKRGYDRAFLRSDYVGLFEVYSEEESDSFKKPEQIPPAIINEKYHLPENELEKIRLKIVELNKKFPSKDKLNLPFTDTKYPGENIVEDILKKHKDSDYLNAILTIYPTNADFLIAIKILQKMSELNRQKKELEAQILLNTPVSLNNENQNESEFAKLQSENNNNDLNKELDEIEQLTEVSEPQRVDDINTSETLSNEVKEQTTEEFLTTGDSEELKSIPLEEYSHETAINKILDAETFLNSLDKELTVQGFKDDEGITKTKELITDSKKED